MENPTLKSFKCKNGQRYPHQNRPVVDLSAIQCRLYGQTLINFNKSSFSIDSI